MKIKLLILLGLAIAAGHAWGYTNPIENQRTEIVTNTWNLGAGVLRVGDTTSGNGLVVTNSGTVKNGTTFIGDDSTSSGNIVTVYGLGSFWDNSETLNVGYKGSSNHMNVVNSGTVTTGSGSIGARDSSLNNIATVSGTGSKWNISRLFYVGQAGASNVLSVTNGGAVNCDSTYIGYYDTAADNRIEVIGSNSKVNAGLFFVGRYGSGNQLAVLNGGMVSNSMARIGYYESSQDNAIIVSGSNSTWNNSSSLHIGKASQGNSIAIYDGGKVVNTSGFVGDESTASHNFAIVSGEDSMWENSSWLYVGNNGANNSLFITNGGFVNNTSGHIGGGSGLSINNMVSVSGSGSTWNNSSTLYVGQYSKGNTLEITNGGTVNSSNGNIGSSSNAVTVSGADSKWINTSRLTVGGGNKGNSLKIIDGGKVTATDSYVSMSDNSVIISGSNSIWSSSQNLYVGNGGAGNSVTITNGGAVSNQRGYIGFYSTSPSNSVMVSGTNSIWRNTQSLSIGTGSGMGNTLTITNGGTVFTKSLTISSNSKLDLNEGGTLDVAGNILVSGGSLQLDGALLLNSENIVDCRLSGNLAIGETGAISLNLDNLENDHLIVTGSANLGGTLEVALLNGFDPDLGDTFDLFDWDGGVSGNFTAVYLASLPFGLEWNTNNLYTDGELSIGYSTLDTDFDGMADGWELQYLGGDASTDGNPDLDPHDNLSEYISGSDPTNGASFFSITNAAPVAAGFVVEWEPSTSNRWYSILWINNLAGGFTSLVDRIEFPQNSYTDTVYEANDAGFYQIDVQMK